MGRWCSAKGVFKCGGAAPKASPTITNDHNVHGKHNVAHKSGYDENDSGSRNNENTIDGAVTQWKWICKS